MKVLVACEYSATVRDAFRARGHDAWSCDILPTDGDPAWHYHGCCLRYLDMGWDLMIAHPPCQYLTNAGIGYFNEEVWGQKATDRKLKREEAMNFFMKLYSAPIPKVCVENPVGYPNRIFRKPDQIIHPYFFGDNHKKRTALWLRGLPKLFYTDERDLFSEPTKLAAP